VYCRRASQQLSAQELRESAAARRREQAADVARRPAAGIGKLDATASAAQVSTFHSAFSTRTLAALPLVYKYCYCCCC
jgi:hypothetical protein